MFMKNNFFYLLLFLFVLYFKEILILNEKFLLLCIFVGFIAFLVNFLKDTIVSFFSNLNKELTQEIFLYEFAIDAKYSYIYFFENVDLLRKKLFSKIYDSYLKSLNFLSIFYYNFVFRKENYNLIMNFESVVNDVYYFILKKHLYIKLNFLYRSYYYIFYKFRTV